MAVSKKNLPDNDAAIAEKHDRRARKDATLNMRLSSCFLDEIKLAAKQEGFEQYQTWVAAVIEAAVDQALPSGASLNSV